MDKKDIIRRCNELVSLGDHLSSEIYFVLKKKDVFEIVKADIQVDTQQELCKLFLATFNETINVEDKSILEISAADSRGNVIYHYDLPECPLVLNLIKNPISNNQKLFSFAEDSFGEIFGYMVKIGIETNYITIFRKHYPVSLISKDRSFSLKRTGDKSRLVKVSNDILKISFGVDFFIIDDDLFIANIDTLERYFDFHDIISREAKKSISIIDKSGLLVETDSLKADIANISFARKLLRMTSAGRVINVIPNATIIKFTKLTPKLKGKFVYNKEGTKILLNTKASRKLFLKIMNDDILVSELTKNYYDSQAKDEFN